MTKFYQDTETGEIYIRDSRGMRLLAEVEFLGLPEDGHIEEKEAPPAARTTRTPQKSEFIKKIKEKASKGGTPSKAKGKYKCRICGEPGHNSVSCPSKKTEQTRAREDAEDRDWREEKAAGARRKLEAKVKTLVGNGLSFHDIRGSIKEKELNDVELEQMIKDAKDELGI